MEADHPSKTRLLEATLKLVRSKGYAATRVDDVCTEAGVTKGSFFHHFKSKDDLALSAAAYWAAQVHELFAKAPYHALAGPRERLLAYVDVRRDQLSGELPEFTCFAGTLVQEVYRSFPELRDACNGSISGHALTLEADIQEAMQQHGLADGGWSAESLALHIQGVLQGAFILAKARNNAEAAVQSLGHLRRYLELLFASPPRPS